MWKVVFEGKSKILSGDYIYKIVIGWCDDEISCGEIVEFISKQVYEDILSGKYFVKVFPYYEKKIVVFDRFENMIPLIRGVEDVSGKKMIKDIR